MKLRTTTPASLSFKTLLKWVIALVIVLGLSLTAISIARNASADQYDDKIRALQADMARYQAEANRLNAEAATLAVALQQISNERAAIQAQVDLSQAQYDKLIIDIAKTEKEIKDNQDGLGDTIADLYMDDNVTPIELLASSTNIGDFLNKQEYRSSVRDQLSNTIKTVKKLKTQLTDQKAEVEKVLTERKNARDALVAKENEQAALLAKTNNDEASYQGLIRNSAQQIAQAKATQAAINARYSGSGGYRIIEAGSAGGYPWNNSNCRMQGYMSTGGAPGTDGEDGFGYGCRQCASYVAWRVGKETGYHPTNWGDAKNFTAAAKRSPWNGVEGGPRAGSIAVMDPGKAGQNHGHTAWVEAVNGNKVIVSQYNYDYGQGYGMYSMMELSVNAFDHYIHIN